ncbi:MAG: LrgB family protein [Alistipes shahii]
MWSSAWGFSAASSANGFCAAAGPRPRGPGFALGAAAHGIGTARAIEIGAAEGALSGLAMALMGLATALLMPLMEKYLY